MPLCFVTFYACVSEEEGGLAIHPHAQTTHDQSIDMLDMHIQSIRRSNPGVRCIVLTSPTTRLDGLCQPFERFDVEVRRDSLMLDRLAAQRQVVHQLHSNGTIVLLDTDILVQTDLSHLEADNTDIAVTWRGGKFPINGGMLVAHCRGGDRAASFFDELLATYQEKYLKEQMWNGDQLALRHLVPTPRRWEVDAVLSPLPDLRVRLLHAKIYNYSPPDAPQAFAVPALRERAIVHFKGHRKRFMRSYWDAVLAEPAMLPV